MGYFYLIFTLLILTGCCSSINNDGNNNTKTIPCEFERSYYESYKNSLEKIQKKEDLTLDNTRKIIYSFYLDKLSDYGRCNEYDDLMKEETFKTLLILKSNIMENLIELCSQKVPRNSKDLEKIVAIQEEINISKKALEYIGGDLGKCGSESQNDNFFP